MDKSDRAKLLQLIEERPAVEEWRSTLTDYERRSLNHPVIVWRKWTAATRVKKPKQRTASVSASEHGRAQAMIEQLQARSITVRAAWLTTWTKSLNRDPTVIHRNGAKFAIRSASGKPAASLMSRCRGAELMRSHCFATERSRVHSTG